MERGAVEQARRAAKEEVPGDRIKDAPALARELRWRVRLANGYASDDDARVRRKQPANGSTNGTKKRKRGEEEKEAVEENPNPTFMHFRPRRWDAVVAHPAEKERKTVKAEKPAAEEGAWTDAWTAVDAVTLAEDAEEVMVESRREVVIKVRRTAKGLERQRVERVLEEWTWGSEVTETAPAAPALEAKDSAASGSSAEPPPAAADGGEDVKMENGD